MVKVNPLFQLFIDQAAQAGETPCVQTSGHTLYYRDVLRCIQHFSSAYQITDGSTLALNISNPLLLYVFCWTALANNCNLLLLPAIQQRTLFCEYTKDIQPAVMITDIETCGGSGIYYIKELPVLTQLPDAALSADAASSQTGLEDKQIFFFSSGTTSLAKMTSTGYGQLLLALRCINRQNLMPYTFRQTVFITPPLYHSYGFSAMMEYSSNGSTVVLPEERNFTGYLKTIANPGLAAVITAVEGVPYYHEQLKLAIKRCKLDALQHIGFGGDAVPLALMEFYRTYKSSITFSVRYGLTEIPSVISLLYLQGGEPLQNNGGSVVPFIKIDCKGGTADAGGEVWVGYNAAVAGEYGVGQLSEGLIFTGDNGYLNGQSLFITGRKKYLGKVRGFTVNTLVLENLLRQHVDIQDAVVLIEKGELQLQVVTAALTAPDISTLIQAALPPQYAPGKIDIVHQIARTETGKIIRHNAETKQS